MWPIQTNDSWQCCQRVESFPTEQVRNMMMMMMVIRALARLHLGWSDAVAAAMANTEMAVRDHLLLFESYLSCTQAQHSKTCLKLLLWSQVDFSPETSGGSSPVWTSDQQELLFTAPSGCCWGRCRTSGSLSVKQQIWENSFDPWCPSVTTWRSWSRRLFPEWPGQESPSIFEHKILGIFIRVRMDHCPLRSSDLTAAALDPGSCRDIKTGDTNLKGKDWI